mmetsp:Transcript_4497/g.11877  ORF Transcript_4497/g.11877 Transcript_4497/m.11877 type:complete len:209 (+) Transcript_4497:317-943(+)
MESLARVRCGRIVRWSRHRVTPTSAAAIGAAHEDSTRNDGRLPLVFAHIRAGPGDLEVCRGRGTRERLAKAIVIRVAELRHAPSDAAAMWQSSGWQLVVAWAWDCARLVRDNTKLLLTREPRCGRLSDHGHTRAERCRWQRRVDAVCAEWRLVLTRAGHPSAARLCAAALRHGLEHRTRVQLPLQRGRSLRRVEGTRKLIVTWPRLRI